MMGTQKILFWTLMISLGPCTYEVEERILTTSYEYVDGKCCQKSCLGVESEAECRNWKNSIFKMNQQQDAVTEERVANLEAKYREVLELRRKAEENRKARLEKLKEQLNATWQVKKAEIKYKLNAEVERVRSACAKARQTTTALPENEVEDNGRKSRPENCSMVCSHVISTKTPNEPVGFATSGTSQRIFPSFNSEDGVLVYCDCTNGSDEAWTVFQRRMDGSVDFNRNWFNYTKGFGNVSGEFWLGLEALSNFTSEGEYELRVDLRAWLGYTAFAEYRSFSVGDAAANFNLTVGNYTGNAGDSLEYHNGVMFSTEDMDNVKGTVNRLISNGWANLFPSTIEIESGGWWRNDSFEVAQQSNLNGMYIRYDCLSCHDFYWTSWNFGYSPLKGSEMKFRKIQKNGHE